MRFARGIESSAIAAAEGDLAATEAGAAGGMEAGRTAGQEAVSAEQDGTKSGDEGGKRSLAEEINSIYATAEQTVGEKLGSLQDNAVGEFREKQAARLESFASGVRAELDAFKEERYSGLSGLYHKGRDWLLGINDLPQVKALYERNRQSYIADIDAMIAAIKTRIETTIQECKDTLAAARKQIDDLATTRAGEMDAEATAALDRARTQFDQMEQRIEATRTAALAALDRERERAIKEMDKALADIRAENEGLVGRIAAAIRALAALLGEFMALLARVTRMGIGAFLSAALSQAKDGVQNNLWGELQNAFKEWIFSKLPVLQILLSLPPNWLDMLTVLATSMIGFYSRKTCPRCCPPSGLRR